MMSNPRRQPKNIEVSVANWLLNHSLTVLRISIGVVYFWFGVLKFFPGLSPAQDLAIRTIQILTFGLLPDGVALFLLTIWEVALGIAFITGVWPRLTLLLMFAHLAGTATPLFFFPQETFTRIPYAPTLEGQYILKNVVLVGSGVVLAAASWGKAICHVAETAVLKPDIPRESKSSSRSRQSLR
ncbi:MAG: DoxX family protein [Anaerolineae bacterium]|nr:DoxX family protein [Anaerolineae bacterium]